MSGRDAAQVGGSALPGGVMMRTRGRVGVAVRSEADGGILATAFAPRTPTGRWASWPLVRGAVAMTTALRTGREAMEVGERLRWGEAAGERDGRGAAATVAVVTGALVGGLLQVLGFRVAPIVIAKEAGLTGAWFIVAEAALRLGLLLGALVAVAALPPFRRLLRYHGAEHKAIAAFEAGAALTAPSAARFTRFHPRCGTSYLVVSAVVSIAVYGAVLAITGAFSYSALIATRLVGGPVVTALTFEIQRQAARRRGAWSLVSRPGLAAQRLTTREPGHGELDVALAALGAALGPEPSRAAARAAA